MLISKKRRKNVYVKNVFAGKNLGPGPMILMTIFLNKRSQIANLGLRDMRNAEIFFATQYNG